jgi:hypothetical protein
VPLGGLECPLQIVEDRQQLAHQPLVRMRDETLLLTRRALPVVLEVRLDALRKVEVLVTFCLDSREALLEAGGRAL